VKYYIYRSKSKIDMLWEQLSSKKVEQYSAELKITLGVISGSIKSEPTEKNLHARLQIVLEDLTREGRIGGLANPSSFVRGVLPMTWQEVNFYRGASDQRMVLFSGYLDQPPTLVGLIGSAAHVSGMNDVVPATLGYAQPSFWNKVLEALAPPTEEQIQENLYDLDNTIDYQARRREDGPPKQRLEFVAKTFFVCDERRAHTQLSEVNFIIGSPLYVAEAPTSPDI
jgi:uncharacterized protein DUF7019